MPSTLCHRQRVCVCVPDEAQVTCSLCLKLFFKKVGVPDVIICDRGGEQIRGDSRKLMRESGTIVKQIDPNTP